MTADLPGNANIVIIGGGVIGCSIAYHLGQLGAPDVLLVERKKLTSGTTWHSAAQVRQLRSTRTMTEIIRYSTELYARLEAETGQATGWTPSGSLSIATNPDRLTHIRRQAGLARCYGVDVHEVGPDEIKSLWPLINMSDIVGGIYCPTDGRANPSDLCAALVKGARANGVKIIEDCAVSGFDVSDGSVKSVATPMGRIKCRTAVLAAGLWSRDIGAMAGINVPVYACEHFYLLTKPMDGIAGHLPTLGDHDGHLYLRDEVGGLLAGCFEPKGKPVSVENLPKDFKFDLLDEDWDHFEPMMLNAMHRIPALEVAEARMLLNGPESFTPDGHPIVGQASGVDGFYLACGLNSAGVACGGGIGRAIAEWIVAGEAPMDLLDVDPSRFHAVENHLPGLDARVGEVLGLHYAIAYPGREHETARNLCCSLLHDRFSSRGARFGQRYGAERPLYLDPRSHSNTALTFDRPAWFDQVQRECDAARSAVAIFDQSLFGKFLIEGKDAEAVLQRACANDMSRAPGRIIYTSMLNTRGGIESDLTAMRVTESSYLFYTGALSASRDSAQIRRHIKPHEHVTITNVTDDYAVLGVMGPNARQLLAKVTDADLSNDAFPYFTHSQIEIAGRSVRAARLSYIGELGWELSPSTEDTPYVIDALLDAGAGFGVRLAGAYAMNAMRIEKSYLSLGHDIGPDTTPLEAGLGFAVKLKSDLDFTGRAALEATEKEGLPRRLVTLILEDPDIYPFGDEPIMAGSELIGQTSSAAFGHTIGKPVALGLIRLEPGQSASDLEALSCTIDVGGRPSPARASLSCPFDPKGVRVHGHYARAAGAA